LDDHVFERLIRDPRYRIGDEDAIRQLQELDTPENYDSDVDMIDDSQVRSPVSPYTSSLFSRSSRRKRGAPSRSEEASLVEHARRSAGVIEQVTPQPISPPSEAPVTKRWFKRMTRTDAQRPPQSNSNPTGDLRLVQARHPIEQTTYFREDFFGSLDWTSRPGSRGPIDETIVPFHVLIDDVDHGMNELKVSNKPSGEAGQRNYTSGLHWGPLTPVLASGEFTGHFVILERLDDGTYRLILTRDEPGPFIR